jgi:hypothetical protein
MKDKYTTNCAKTRIRMGKGTHVIGSWPGWGCKLEDSQDLRALLREAA